MDPEAECARCATRKKLARFTPEFRAWMAGLLDLYDRMGAGWKLENDDLTLDEWRALARVKQWFDFKREEARVRMGLL